ncbi:hypothetical protein GCM10027030_06670 [Luteococcus sediminum]
MTRSPDGNGPGEHGTRLHPVRVGEVGYRMHLPWAETDSIQHHVASTAQPYEQEMVEDLLARTREGDLVVDVGANIGNHSLAWGAHGRDVIAFEPHHELAEALRVSVEANQLTGRVEVVEQALSDHDGRSRLVGMTEQNMGIGHLDEGSTGIEVTVGILTDPGRAVAAIKVDTEGTEVEVLRGAMPVIERHHPLLYVECLDEQAFADVWALLEPLGYHYEQTFNASPTHRFAWSAEPRDQSGVTGLLLRYHQAQVGWTTSREHLYEANAKYRQATALVSDLQQQLLDLKGEHAARLREARAAADTQLRAQRQAADRQREGLLQELADRAGRLGWAREREEARRIIASLERPGMAPACPQPEAVHMHVEDLQHLRTWIGERQAAEREMTGRLAELEGVHRQLEEEQKGRRIAEGLVARQLRQLDGAQKERGIADGLIARLRRQLEGLEGRHRREKQALQDRSAALEQEVADMRTRARELEGDLARMNTVLQDHALVIDRQAGEAQQWAGQVDRLAGTVQNLEQQNRQLRHELSLLRRSRTMRVGKEFGRTRGPVTVLTLPWRLYTAGRTAGSPTTKEINP